MRWIAFVCCFLVVVLAQAGNSKIATIDMKKLVSGYPGTADMKKKLQSLVDKKKADLAETEQDLVDKEKEFKDSSSVMSDSQKKAKEAELQQAEQDLQQQESDAQNYLQEKEAEMTDQVVGEIKQIVATVAKNEGYDLVLDSEGVVYSKDAVDITDDVLKSFPKSSSSDSSDSGN